MVRTYQPEHQDFRRSTPIGAYCAWTIGYGIQVSDLAKAGVAQ